eukprot:TRINITY_DN44385_c0_g1_i1.p1 TRINITY_DN44385_c0_g1~~TRINITY_DN44385_c0_g1_i1.p1  ORF type:complete len:243 (+),score=18.80 TRINITY_DN44385_c0_g1_i1:85-729(+)
MDEFGNTHFLRAKPGGGSYGLRSHGNNCVRIASLSRDKTYLRFTMSRPLGNCIMLAHIASCGSGPLPCTRGDWMTAEYMAEPSRLRVTSASVDGFERVHRGSNAWILGSVVLSRRRRRRQIKGNPMHLSGHGALRQLSRVIPYFRYPHVQHFQSAASLFRGLLDLDPASTSAAMRRWSRHRQMVALDAWRYVLEEVVTHPSQKSAASFYCIMRS